MDLILLPNKWPLPPPITGLHSKGHMEEQTHKRQKQSSLDSLFLTQTAGQVHSVGQQTGW